MWDKVIFVCKSGTCRAPMAAALLRECSMKREIEILARGLVVLFPEPLNQKVDAILISNGINMEGYMSEQLVAEDVDEHTLVLVMEEKFLPQAAAILGEELEIMDPYGAPLPSYGLCFESLSKTVRKLANWLNEQEETAHE